MQERPIGILVEALQQLGAEIRYEKKKGYPPILIERFRRQKTKEITMRGDVSSQFISALIMTAPRLPQGLTIHLEGKLGSRPYLELTAALMEKFGIKILWDGNVLHIPHGRYHSGNHEVESDWSGAGYWFSMASLADEVDLYLKGLRSDSLQADKKAVEIYAGLGVHCRFDEEGLHLSKTNTPAQASASIDFSDCPDLAQTVAVSYAALGLDCTFTGLESLRVKETDRIAALQQELAKIGAQLLEKEEGSWSLIGTKALPEHVEIQTYDDHRMAMAFAPLMYRMHVDICEPMVVAKSYPEFWEHLGVSNS
jgi:3-phosphoshikimate 1-carboxyvinyltransferase